MAIAVRNHTGGRVGDGLRLDLPPAVGFGGKSRANPASVTAERGVPRMTLNMAQMGSDGTIWTIDQATGFAQCCVGNGRWHANKSRQLKSISCVAAMGVWGVDTSGNACALKLTPPAQVALARLLARLPALAVNAASRSCVADVIWRAHVRILRCGEVRHR